jgi:hypothetical protein
MYTKNSAELEDGIFATNARIIGIPILKFQIPMFRFILRTTVEWGVGSWEWEVLPRMHEL